MPSDENILLKFRACAADRDKGVVL